MQDQIPIHLLRGCVAVVKATSFERLADAKLPVAIGAKGEEVVQVIYDGSAIAIGANLGHIHVIADLSRLVGIFESLVAELPEGVASPCIGSAFSIQCD